MKTYMLFPRNTTKPKRVRLSKALTRMWAPQDLCGLVYFAFVGWLCFVFAAGWLAILLWL